MIYETFSSNYPTALEYNYSRPVTSNQYATNSSSYIHSTESYDIKLAVSLIGLQQGTSQSCQALQSFRHT